MLRWIGYKRLLPERSATTGDTKFSSPRKVSTSRATARHLGGIRSDGVPKPLCELRIVELSAFIAAPLGGMTLAQLGADVIRIDPIGGNIDYRRWPLSPLGSSLYWAGLNKSKR